MRFLENGANIPDDLIRAVNEGSATFLCGAGVSHRVDLPLFKELTELVYKELGETQDAEPAERKAFDEKQYDRALRSLEKRTYVPKTNSRVRTAVINHLAVPKCALPDHLAIVQLSRDADGRPRLLTTNFDTLFEQAAASGGMKDVESHAGKSIPKAGSDRDHGIMHLHGRIADLSIGLKLSDLVLTSADFGDAYIRDGWAAQYIEDRMRMGTLVLVGYQAEDAAMRLLLETLDADRDRFPDLKKIYAIEKGAPESASVWRAKGIIPIEFPDYNDIYATLREWARYTMKSPRKLRLMLISWIEIIGRHYAQVILTEHFVGLKRPLQLAIGR
jgi:SIR2-like domain